MSTAQGAYVYTLYKDEKHLPESTVASLFTCGFLAAAMAALVVGSLADRYGRRLACLAFCVLYTASCLTKISDSVAVLWAGRLLGGVCTTLLFSTFESWMVTECFTQGKDASLYTMFGIMSTLNSIVAIASGLVGEGLVAATGTKVSPFLAACVCLVLAFLFMAKHWVCPTSSQDAAKADCRHRARTTAEAQSSQGSVSLKSPCWRRWSKVGSVSSLASANPMLTSH